MIHIVHVISDLDTGGAEMMLAKLVEGMDRRQFENTVVSLLDHGTLGRDIEVSGSTVHCLGMSREKNDAYAILRLVRILRATRPTLVQSWLYHADLMATLATKWTGSFPVIWNLRCSDMDLSRYSLRTRLVRKALAFLSRTPAVVISNSEEGRRWHSRLGYRPRRWDLIPNGFDMNRFKPDPVTRESVLRDLKVPLTSTVIGHIARVDLMKDHTTFLLAAKAISTQHPDVMFIMVGKGTETLAPRLVELQLEERVRLLGLRSDVDRLLACFDVFCLSSAFGEGFPNVLGEAMAAAVPCVTTDVGDARQIVGSAGLVVPPRNVPALADALLHFVLCGKEERTRLGLLARQHVKEHYSLEKVVAQYEQLYTEIARGAVA